MIVMCLDCCFGWVCKLVLLLAFWVLLCVGLPVVFSWIGGFECLSNLWVLFCFGDLRCDGIWWLCSVLVLVLGLFLDWFRWAAPSVGFNLLPAGCYCVFAIDVFCVDCGFSLVVCR